MKFLCLYVYVLQVLCLETSACCSRWAFSAWIFQLRTVCLRNFSALVKLNFEICWFSSQLGGFPVTSEVSPPLCYSDAAHQSMPCGRCNVHPTHVDIGTGQVSCCSYWWFCKDLSHLVAVLCAFAILNPVVDLQTTDMYVYTYNHTKDGWFCPGWGGEGSTIDNMAG